jgi:hypothetical protein
MFGIIGSRFVFRSFKERLNNFLWRTSCNVTRLCDDRPILISSWPWIPCSIFTRLMRVRSSHSILVLDLQWCGYAGSRFIDLFVLWLCLTLLQVIHSLELTWIHVRITLINGLLEREVARFDVASGYWFDSDVTGLNRYATKLILFDCFGGELPITNCQGGWNAEVSKALLGWDKIKLFDGGLPCLIHIVI